VSAQAIVCTSCGANLDPRILETKVKCTYCGTVFAIVRDQGGVSGIAPEDQAPGHRPEPAPGSTPWSAPGGPGAKVGSAPQLIAGMDQQTVERIERDALLVVRGLEAVEQTALATSRGGRGCLGSVLFFVVALVSALVALGVA